MSVPKIETDRFDGKSNFVMWQGKMKAVLVQNKIAPAICSPEEYPESWKGEILEVKLDLDLQKENKSHGENLFVRGRIDQRETPSRRFKSRSKSREKNYVVASEDWPHYSFLTNFFPFLAQFSLIDPVMLWATTETDRLLVLCLGCPLGRSSCCLLFGPPLDPVLLAVASGPPLDCVFREIPAAWAGHLGRLLVTRATVRLAPS
ncbi:hypothetical protein M9H77_06709 [Catharanthus roseus]|uniref:Uncharacterized protein n=1 Tax=Catharanthus roseus TaxID=4058 RepID=A0ACC0BT26_CATRO|nr:hypothetical protein M9H77_06709 [Catharanthus roseus]